MADKKIPEVDIIVDEKAGVIKEVAQPQKLRSKKGHERRVNGAIYTVLTVMSIVWLVPFVFLVFQSFRSYLTESGGMVNYLLPKQWSLDNYKFLFEGSDFFSWCGKALLAAGIAALAQTALLAIVKKVLAGRDASDKLSRFLYPLAALLLCGALLIGLTAAFHGFVLAENVVKSILALAAYAVVGFILGRIYLKQDDRLLRTIPGYEAEGAGEKFRKVASLFGEFLALGLIIQAVLKPMQTSQYLNWYGNTLTIALFVAVLQTAIVLSVSYALSRLRFKGRKLIMNAVLVLGLFPASSP